MRFADRTEGINSSFIRDILKLTKQKDIISFAGGLPNASLFPLQNFEKAASDILSDDKLGREALQYGESAGYSKLKEIIARSYKEKDNLEIDPELIIITNGSQQALDLIGKVFINEGDKVIVENPTYLAALQSLQFYKPQFIPVSLSDVGPNTAELSQTNDAKIFYAIPNFQNPTGITWSDELRAQVGEIAKDKNIILVEDDPYGEIRFEGERQTPILKFYKNTIMLGSFSKILAPGLRLGWAIAPDKEVYDKLLLAKQSADLHTSQFTQMIAVKFYEDFDAQNHIEKISKVYKKGKDAMITALQNCMPEIRFTNPEGGMFLWVTFDEKVDSVELLKYAISEKVAFVPGVPFYAKSPSRNTARLNFTNTDTKGIDTGMQRLSQAYKKYMSDMTNL